jgi:hypothetical protein
MSIIESFRQIISPTNLEVEDRMKQLDPFHTISQDFAKLVTERDPRFLNNLRKLAFGDTPFIDGSEPTSEGMTFETQSRHVFEQLIRTSAKEAYLTSILRGSIHNGDLDLLHLDQKVMDDLREVKKHDGGLNEELGNVSSHLEGDAFRQMELLRIVGLPDGVRTSFISDGNSLIISTNPNNYELEVDSSESNTDHRVFKIASTAAAATNIMLMVSCTVQPTPIISPAQTEVDKQIATQVTTVPDKTKASEVKEIPVPEVQFKPLNQQEIIEWSEKDPKEAEWFKQVVNGASAKNEKWNNSSTPVTYESYSSFVVITLTKNEERQQIIMGTLRAPGQTSASMYLTTWGQQEEGKQVVANKPIAAMGNNKIGIYDQRDSNLIFRPIIEKRSDGLTVFIYNGQEYIAPNGNLYETIMAPNKEASTFPIVGRDANVPDYFSPSSDELIKSEAGMVVDGDVLRQWNPETQSWEDKTASIAVLLGGNKVSGIEKSDDGLIYLTVKSVGNGKETITRALLWNDEAKEWEKALIPWISQQLELPNGHKIEFNVGNQFDSVWHPFVKSADINPNNENAVKNYKAVMLSTIQQITEDGGSVKPFQEWLTDTSKYRIRISEPGKSEKFITPDKLEKINVILVTPNDPHLYKKTDNFTVIDTGFFLNEEQKTLNMYLSPTQNDGSLIDLEETYKLQTDPTIKANMLFSLGSYINEAILCGILQLNYSHDLDIDTAHSMGNAYDRAARLVEIRKHGIKTIEERDREVPIVNLTTSSQYSKKYSLLVATLR